MLDGVEVEALSLKGFGMKGPLSEMLGIWDALTARWGMKLRCGYRLSEAGALSLSKVSFFFLFIN